MQLLLLWCCCCGKDKGALKTASHYTTLTKAVALFTRERVEAMVVRFPAPSLPASCIVCVSPLRCCAERGARTYRQYPRTHCACLVVSFTACFSLSFLLSCARSQSIQHLGAVGMSTALRQRGTPNFSTRAVLWLLFSIVFSIATCTEATRNPHATMPGADRTSGTSTDYGSEVPQYDSADTRPGNNCSRRVWIGSVRTREPAAAVLCPRRIPLVGAASFLDLHRARDNMFVSRSEYRARCRRCLSAAANVHRTAVRPTEGYGYAQQSCSRSIPSLPHNFSPLLRHILRPSSLSPHGLPGSSRAIPR